MAVTMIRSFVDRADLFEYNLKYLMLVGLWPDENWSKIQLNLYKMHEVTIHVLTMGFLITTGIGLYEHKNDGITVVLSSIDIILAGYQFFFKAIVFIGKRERLRVLIKDIVHSGDTISTDRKQFMASLVTLLTLMALSVVACFAAVSLIKFETVVDNWVPFDPLKNRINLALSIQIVGFTLIPCICRGLALQGIVCSLMMYVCDQLIELQQRLRALTYSQENENSMRQEFKEIIKKHIRLMGYSKCMDEVFKEFFLIHNFAVTFELCLNAVMITVAEEKQDLVSFLAFLGVALLNAFVFCYLGNELIIQSENIALTAYEASWNSWPVDLQKDLLILIMVAQRPFQLTAGGMVTMCLQTYGQALYNGYSIFAVLSDIVN